LWIASNDSQDEICLGCIVMIYNSDIILASFLLIFITFNKLWNLKSGNA
jgi:hypothetical protein